MITATETQWDKLYDDQVSFVDVDGVSTPASPVYRTYRFRDSWGEFVEYGDDSVFMIFSVGNNTYRINGFQDSWSGSPKWDGEPFPATPVIKTITVWE